MQKQAYLGISGVILGKSTVIYGGNGGKCRGLWGLIRVQRVLIV